MDVSGIISAIKQLVSTEGEEGGELTQRLQANLSSLDSFLMDPKHVELRRKLATLKEECGLVSEATDWNFTTEGLCLLLALDDALKVLSAEDQRTVTHEAAATSKAPPTPKCLLSIADQKVVQTLFQFIVPLGIYPYLLPGVDTFLKLRLSHAHCIAKAEKLPLAMKAWHLRKCCQVILKCFENPVLGPVLLSQHLSDVLAALLQVCYGPVEQPSGQMESNVCEKTPSLATPADIVPQLQSSEESGSRSLSVAEKEWCEEALQKLLNQVYQPLVVRELLVLQGMPVIGPGPHSKPKRSTRIGAAAPAQVVTKARVRSPKWLQKACGQLLSERLMQRNGVQSVLRGIFEVTAAMGPEGRVIRGGTMGGEESAADWRKCQAVARIISSCPSQAASLEEYYSSICPQILALLHLPVEGIGRQFLRVAAATISAMLTSQKLLAVRYLINPLMRPLRQLSGEDPLKERDFDGFVKGLQACIEDLHKICGVMEPSSPFVTVLLPYLPVLFEIWRVCCSCRDSQIKVQARDVFLQLVKSVETTTVVSVLKFLAHMPLEPEVGVEFKSPDPGVALKYDQHDGFSLEWLSGEERMDVERMESIASCVLDLLTTDLKTSGLVGLLFTECLQHIAVTLCQTTGCDAADTSLQSRLKMPPPGLKQNPSGSTSSDLLECERNPEVISQSEAYGNALVLYLTAALCEHMSNEVIEQVDLPLLIETISVIVKSHARFVSKGQSSDILLVTGPNLEKLFGGSITLSMVFGLLSAILGGAREVERKDRPLLSRMLQELETLATKYPDPELSGLASDLRICIATLGAVWSAEMRERAAEVGGNLTKKAKSTAAEQYKSKDGNFSRSSKQLGNPESNISQELGYQKASATSEVPASKDAGNTSLQETAQVAEKEVHPKLEKACETESTPFHHALQDLKDPLLPIQGHGLVTLTKLIEKKNPEALENFSVLLTIFRESLRHSDSYIYLTAIDGLVALASVMPQEVIPILCQEYAQLPSQPSSENQHKYDKETGTLECRKTSKGGEAVSMRNVELRMKLGEALVRSTRDCGEMLPHYSDTILAAILSSVRDPDPLIRTSSLSNLADVCSLLSYSFRKVQNEVLSCISHILQTDQEAKVRQAALVVLKLLIKGLSQDVAQVLGESLLEVYRLLKRVEGNEMEEELTKTHAQAALGELDSVMRGLLFPQQTLSKRITILDKL